MHANPSTCRAHCRCCDGGDVPAQDDREVPASATVLTALLAGSLAGFGVALPADRASSPARGYPPLLGLTTAYPTTVIYFVSLVGGRRGRPSLPADVAFVAGAVVASASWQLMIVAGGTGLGRLVTGRRARVGTGLASAALICALAVRRLLD